MVLFFLIQRISAKIRYEFDKIQCIQSTKYSSLKYSNIIFFICLGYALSKAQSTSGLSSWGPTKTLLRGGQREHVRRILPLSLSACIGLLSSCSWRIPTAVFLPYLCCSQTLTRSCTCSWGGSSRRSCPGPWPSQSIRKPWSSFSRQGREYH